MQEMGFKEGLKVIEVGAISVIYGFFLNSVTFECAIFHCHFSWKKFF